MAISFITNTKKSHRELLLNLFEESDDIIFAVGFLKNSGLNNIKEYLKEFCLDQSKKSTFFIGTGLGETNPDALIGLYNIIKRKKNHSLVLCTPDAGIFHPKIYVFCKGSKVTIVTGSANLTEAGWMVNDEVSVVLETTINSPDYIQLKEYFNKLNSTYFTEDIADLIQKYTTQLEEFENKYSPSPSFRFRRKKTSIAGIDMPRLKGYYEQYKNNPEWFVEPSDRERTYENAKLNLEVLAGDKRLNAQQFHDLFGPLVGHEGYNKLWHSGSIHRKTHKTLDYANEFRNLVRVIKQNTRKSVNTAFANSIAYLNDKRKGKEISGIGENIVTEIMMSYNYSKFANLNKNPITVLSLIGKDFKGASSFKGDDYEEYVSLLTRIRDELKMNSFLEIDSFFNYVYWNLLEE